MLDIEILDDFTDLNWLRKLYISYRRCYSGDNIEDIKIPSIPKMIEFIEEHSRHSSPLEHMQISIHVSGISRVLTHQLVRHRIASYSQMSQRYVKKIPVYITPPTIQENPEALLIYEKYLNEMNDIYNKLLSLEIPNEDARYVFPNCMETKIVISMNVKSWKHFFNERCCDKAQWEIRNLANSLLKEFRSKIPVLFNDSGPKCILYKRCTEKKSCGKVNWNKGYLND